MRSEMYEQALNRQGVTWEYMDKLEIDQIDTNKSLRNQARLDEPKSQDLIESYKDLQKQGYEAPPIVVWRPGRGKFIICDGNQRTHAKIELGISTTDAYYVKNIDKKTIDRLTWVFNNLVNGRRLTREECFQHALSYVREYGVPSSEAAKEWGLSARTLEDKLRVENSKDKLRERNVKITPALSDDHIRTLQPILQVGEDKFCEAAEMIATSGITLDETRDLVRDVKSKKDNEAKIKVIEEFGKSQKVIERKAETKGGTVKVRPDGPREKYRLAYKTIWRLHKDFSHKALQPHSADWKEFRQMLIEIFNREVKEYGLGNIIVDQTEVG